MKYRYGKAISAFAHTSAALFWAKYRDIFKDLNAHKKALKHLAIAEIDLMEFKYLPKK